MLAPDKIMSSIDSRSVPAHSRAGGDNESLTGPDRNIANIRRQGSLRRSLRSSRCQSVVITEKERTLLIKQDKKMAGRGSEGFAEPDQWASAALGFSCMEGDRGTRKRRFR